MKHHILYEFKLEILKEMYLYLLFKMLSHLRFNLRIYYLKYKDIGSKNPLLF